jgi:hypothetical protein
MPIQLCGLYRIDADGRALKASLLAARLLQLLDPGGPGRAFDDDGDLPLGLHIVHGEHGTAPEGRGALRHARDGPAAGLARSMS